MRIIALASQKGGSGKTTLATHLAVQAEKMGAGPIGVIDTDPQGTLADLREARTGDAPRFANAGPQGLAKLIEAMRAAGIKLLFIDTPPAIGTTIGRVIKLADMVVIPTRPSPNDLRAIGATVALVEGLGKPLVFVVNGAAPRARITAEAVVALAQHGPVAPTIVHQRVAFAASMIDGRTAMELPGGARSADEVAAVWTYLKKRMARVTANARTGRPAVPAGKKPAAARKARKSPVARQRKTTEQTVARKRKTAEQTVTRKRKKPAAVKAVKPRARRTRKVSAPLRKAA
jgi:chromosome partitioning protein